jgi:ribosomal-protein-alanine N-acetyltransferase
MIKGNKVRLRAKKLSDARNDYRWQTDPDLVRLDATLPLTMPYSRYLMEYSDELHRPDPTRRLLGVETVDGEHIGNCVYYNVDRDKNEAELGIMIGNRDYWDASYGEDAMVTLVDYLFARTDLKRIYLKTLQTNQRARKCFQKSGFSACGQALKGGHDFLLMEIRRPQWEERRAGADR